MLLTTKNSWRPRSRPSASGRIDTRDERSLASSTSANCAAAAGNGSNATTRPVSTHEPRERDGVSAGVRTAIDDHVAGTHDLRIERLNDSLERGVQARQVRASLRPDTDGRVGKRHPDVVCA